MKTNTPTLRLLIILVLFAFAGSIKLLAAAFIGLAGAYPTGNGCFTALHECSAPSGSTNGVLTFYHTNTTDASFGGLGIRYTQEYTSAQWGNYGTFGTGINYCTATAWSQWASFWTPWGEPNQ